MSTFEHVEPRWTEKEMGFIVNAGERVWAELLEQFYELARRNGWRIIHVQGHGIYEVPPA